jgi:hypothetical protein
MAFSYECDFYLQAGRLTPIEKRQDVRLGLLESTSSPIQWNRDNFFDGYLEGDSASVWIIATSYSRYDRVNYQNRIYECTNDNTGELPTNTDYWVKVLDDFRGATERIKYNCQKLMIEWVLNKWFGTTFNQPSTLLNSDFYIENNVRFASPFTVPETTFRDGLYVSNAIFESSKNTTKYVKNIPAYLPSQNFTVFYPLSVIANTTDDEYYQMTALINKYKVLGSTAAYTGY